MIPRIGRLSPSYLEHRPARARLRSATAVALTVGMVAAAALLGGPAATAVSRPAAPAASASTKPAASFENGRYIVTLAASALATYSGGVQGYAATKPARGKQLDTRSKNAAAYAGHLKAEQKKVAADAGVSVRASFTTAINAFTADLTAAQAAKLYADRAVLAVEKDSIRHITAQSSTDFLGLGGADGLGGVWESTGGVAKAGAGIVVGIIDTGIAPENRSFAGDTLGTSAGTAPHRAADGSISFAKADGGTFTGACVTGVQFTAADCNTKVVGARYYVDGFGAKNIGGVDVGEYLSPRDGDGHGSHTGSTAVGNHAVAASVGGLDFGTISGVAPAAKISAYKVCWSGPNDVSQDDDGCASSDLVAAINQATADGVDVINFSIGGGAANTTVSATDVAFLGAASAGIFVAASAGNAGPGASTLDNASPWITTVAASTIPSHESTVTFGDSAGAFAGGSVTVPASGVTGAFVRADLVAVAGATDPLLCAPNSLDPAKVAGKIVFCQRGVYDRVAKSAEVRRAGGIGMVLVNKTSSSLDLDGHSIPAVHLNSEAFDVAFAYAATAGATVTLTPGNTISAPLPTPQVAGFSSRGPVLADGSDIIKPDISAPGVAILAGGANAAGEEGTYKFLSGTSMSSPQIAGLAALYLGVNAQATPAEIKSAFMTTAYDTKSATGTAVTDPFAQGAGHVDPTKFFNPGLVYRNGPGDWWSYIKGAGYTWEGSDEVTAVDPSNLNLASIGIGSLAGTGTVTRTVTATQGGTFAASTTGLAGLDVVVSPATMTLAAGESRSYTVTFTRTTAALSTFATGSLNWTSGDTVVHSPVAVKPVALEAPAVVNSTGRSGSVTVAVTPGSTGRIDLQEDGLTAGVLLKDKTTSVRKPYTGIGAAGAEITFDVTVPKNTRLQRFDLDSRTDAADLDLIVYRLSGKGGTPVAGWQSATGATDEHIDLIAPTAGYYRVIVSVFSGTDSYDLTTFSVRPHNGTGRFTVKPDPLHGVQGVKATYKASWSGLSRGTDYLGLVRYGTTDLSTIVSVKN